MENYTVTIFILMENSGIYFMQLYYWYCITSLRLKTAVFCILMTLFDYYRYLFLFSIYQCGMNYRSHTLELTVSRLGGKGNFSKNTLSAYL